MAQKRMIDKKVSVSEQVADLPILGQLVFTWSVPHSDDVGFLPFSHRSLKAMIIPMMDISIPEFDKIVKQILEKGLWKLVEYEDQKFYCIAKFKDHQTIKKDRQPQILLKFPLDKNPKVSWSMVGDILETLGFQMEDNGFQMESELNRTELKGTELKLILERFDIFYKAYPRKVSKKKASESYVRIMKNSEEDKRGILAGIILVGLENYKKCDQWTKDNGKFIPHPTTWLNQERWNDVVEVATVNVIKKI